MNKYWFIFSWKYKSGKSYVFIFVYAYEKDIDCPRRIELTQREKCRHFLAFGLNMQSTECLSSSPNAGECGP